MIQSLQRQSNQVAMQEENVVEGKLQFANVANNFIFQKVYNILCQ
jgi:hypothetical protein